MELHVGVAESVTCEVTSGTFAKTNKMNSVGKCESLFIIKNVGLVTLKNSIHDLLLPFVNGRKMEIAPNITPSPCKKTAVPEKTFSLPVFTLRNPPKPKAAGAGIIITASQGAPSDIGSHSAHEIEFFKDGAFVDTKMFGNFSGGTGVALADQLIQALDSIVAVC